jgi:hypothetical protein
MAGHHKARVEAQVSGQVETFDPNEDAGVNVHSLDECRKKRRLPSSHEQIRATIEARSGG